MNCVRGARYTHRLPRSSVLRVIKGGTCAYNAGMGESISVTGRLKRGQTSFELFFWSFEPRLFSRWESLPFFRVATNLSCLASSFSECVASTWCIMFYVYASTCVSSSKLRFNFVRSVELNVISNSVTRTRSSARVKTGIQVEKHRPPLFFPSFPPLSFSLHLLIFQRTRDTAPS